MDLYLYQDFWLIPVHIKKEDLQRGFASSLFRYVLYLKIWEFLIQRNSKLSFTEDREPVDETPPEENKQKTIQVFPYRHLFMNVPTF